MSRKGSHPPVAFSSYIIAATPRSGSTLLCDLLSTTSVAGQPESYYRSEDIQWFAGAWGLSAPDVIGEEAFERAYLAAVRRAGAGETGIFGLRLMWASVAELLARLSLIQPKPA
jgi:trehalose 2-sulfotransferase